MTIVHCDYRPNRPRKKKAAVELPRDAALAASHGGQSRGQPQAAARDVFPCGRIVTAKPPRKRHYGVIRDGGMPDEAQRTELIRQFMERTLKRE